MHIKRNFDLSFDSKSLFNRIRDKNLKHFKNREIHFSLFHQIYQDLQDLIEPCVIWDTYKIKYIEADKFKLQDGTLIGGGPMIILMKEASSLVLGICSLGNGIDIRIKLLKQQKKIIDFRIMDGLSSWMVEELRKQFFSWFRNEIIQKQYHTSIMLLPGSTEWDLSDNKKIFNLLKPSAINISIDKRHFMIPTKSLSFAFGISPNKFKHADANRCEFCFRKNSCSYYFAQKEDLIIIF